MSEPALAAAPEPTSSFKFLDFFEEADHDLFAGRDREVNEVLAGILRARTLVLYGRSGLGKTSLLLAGLFPEIRKRGLTPVYMRPFDQPLADLRSALEESFPDLDITPESTLADILRIASAKQGIVLVLDQLEELFIRFRERSVVRWEFIETIAGVAKDPTLEVRVVFSLREDYLAELDDFRAHLPEFFANEYRLHPLTAFGARQAISRALQHAGLSYEQRLLAGLVDVLEEYRYDPTILQILCSELYREMEIIPEAPGMLKTTDLVRLGGLEGIFRSYLENLGKVLEPEQRLLAMVVLDSLVTREHTKNSVTVKSLLDGYFIAGRVEVIEILRLLVTHRLVRRVERGTENRFELIHDRLVDPIQGWLTLDPRFFALRSANDLVIHAALSGSFRRRPELLLTAGQLRFVVGEFRDQLRFSIDQLELLFRSAVYHHAPVLDWAVVLSSEQGMLILLEMLASTDAQVRKGAAKAVGSLPTLDRGGCLANRCVELALDDEDQEVRRVAAQSLTKLGHSSRMSSLVERLRSSKTRNSALEALADIGEAGNLPGNVTLIWRTLVERVIRARRVQQYQHTIRKRGFAGALYGGLAALAYSWWSILGIFNALELIYWVSLGVAVGGLLGWAAGSSSAKICAAHGRSSWFESIWRSSAHLLALTAYLLFFVLFKGTWNPSWLAAPFLVHLLIALQAFVAQRCIGLETSRLRSWGWIVLHTFSLSLLILMILGLPSSLLGIPVDMITVSMFLWYVSFPASISALVFSERKVPFPAEIVHPSIQAWARMAAVGSLELLIFFASLLAVYVKAGLLVLR